MGQVKWKMYIYIYIYIAYNFSHFAICLPKFIKIRGNLTTFWQKQKCTVFLDTVYTQDKDMLSNNATSFL